MKQVIHKIKSLTEDNIFIAFLRLIRFPNLIILGVMDYFARIFLIGEKESWYIIIHEPEIFYLTFSTILIAAGGYIINDYYDIKIDMINKPDRVVLGKYISRRAAIVLHLSFNILAIGICVWKLTINVAVFIALCGLLLWWYSNQLKRMVLWGNLSIALLAFSTLVILALFYQIKINAILFFSFFAFFTTLIREIIKDMEDTKGDEAYGCHTLPISYGIAFTKKIVYLIIALTLSVLLASILVVNIRLYIFLAIFSFIPCLYLIYMLIKADKPSDFLILSSYAKWQMVIGILGMIWV